VITAAVFVPSTPMLVPAVSCGAAAELDDVRDAAITALREALVPGASRVVVVGAGTATRRHPHGTGTFRGFGVALDVPLDPAVASSERLPLALTIGAWLLTQVGWHGDRVALEVDPASGDPALDAVGAALAAEPGSTVLLVVADGSAARSEKAPASLHPDAEAFDSAVSAALAAGVPTVLAALDRDLALAVTAAGRPAWRVAAAALEGSAYDAVVLADTAPYGVGYLVARWLRA
jgi:hypothetical protein